MHEAECMKAHGAWEKKLRKILPAGQTIINPLTIQARPVTRKDIGLLKDWDSVRASVWDSVWAYTGSFFSMPRKSWLYTDKIKSTGYPFQPCVDLWKRGLAPSFDGKTWRLHAGPKAAVVYEWTPEKDK